LIYYQQGLNDAEVAKRTEATIKLANVTRTSAETVSEWMTSIWNNFDNGSKALEYYADVITALGAATASSSEEIATGLEKFAAVAESVGLSYEYATSALATITATTRQSADVVGTALKTLFARMQDLELGKTLDDGTSLGQYSENLAKIGVNVLDASGQLRDMDNVLNDLGERWKSLTQAQKVATAQGVAGIRQYTQFMALMENWDFMQQNLATAQGSSGALQTQSEIYAESWEAAQKRVTSSAEAIYDSLLDDEAFIKLTNIFADFLDVLNPLLKGLGGIPGIIGMVTAAVVKLKG
jgi:TP901 family phage tail tape measure protein